MLEIFKQYIFQATINFIAVIYVLSRLLDEKINLKNHRVYITLIIFIISGILNYVYINSLIRLLTMTIVVIIGTLILFKKDLKTCIVISFFEQTLIVLIEVIISFVIIFLFNMKSNEIRDEFSVSIYCVSLISIIIILISRLKVTKQLYLFLMKITDKIKIFHLIIYIFIIMISINFLIVSNYTNLNFQNLFLINNIILIIYSIILYYAIYKNNENIEFKQKNEILINNLNEYEKMLDYQRINNHENKNQLLVIKSMLKRNDEKTIDYINEIIKEKREDNEIIYTKAKRIPSGGLQGLIYQKMLVMQEKNIEVILDVSTQVRKVNLSNISPKMNYDICRVVGVILDNAIEETIKFDKCEREIIISMYVDEYFFIEVSNKIKGNIDINKIKENGYTTKTNGHGYGLSLLDKIVNENSQIFNNIKIINNIFTQIVKIKM